MPGRLSAITQAIPQLIATATLRLDTAGAGFSDITQPRRKFHRASSALATARC